MKIEKLNYAELMQVRGGLSKNYSEESNCETKVCKRKEVKNKDRKKKKKSCRTRMCYSNALKNVSN